MLTRNRILTRITAPADQRAGEIPSGAGLKTVRFIQPAPLFRMLETGIPQQISDSRHLCAEYHSEKKHQILFHHCGISSSGVPGQFVFFQEPPLNTGRKYCTALKLASRSLRPLALPSISPTFRRLLWRAESGYQFRVPVRFGQKAVQ